MMNHDVIMVMPDEQIRPYVYVEGAPGASSGAVSVVTTADGASDVPFSRVRPASASSDYQNFNSIIVGGPCVNPIAATLLNSSSAPGECTNGFSDGSAMIKYIQHANGNVAVVVAGYSADDTTRAVNALSGRDSRLAGNDVTVTAGATASDFVVTPTQ